MNRNQVISYLDKEGVNVSKITEDISTLSLTKFLISLRKHKKRLEAESVDLGVTFNNNAQAIAFLETFGRGMANASMSYYLTGVEFNSAMTALDISAVVPNDSNVINDGNILEPVTDSELLILAGNTVTQVGSYTANSDLILNQTLPLSTSASSQVPG